MSPYVTEMDDAKLLRMIEQDLDNDDDDDESNEHGQQPDKGPKSDGSIVSEEDFFNRSLQSEEEAIDATNFLRYAGGKETHKFHLLEIVDRNERAYKSNAERMVNQGSQLISVGEQANQVQQQRRLTHQKIFTKIAEKCVVPGRKEQSTCIASLEEYIAVGTNDGTVRVFDSTEFEIKTLSDRTVKGHPVTCMDMKRVDKNQNVFVVCGHSRG